VPGARGRARCDGEVSGVLPQRPDHGRPELCLS
jgi:hypothetical protein